MGRNREAKRAYDKRYRRETREQRREYQRAYRLANPEKVRELGRVWREANPDYHKSPAVVARVAEQGKEYYATHTDAKRESGQRYYAANRERISARHKRYIENNPHVLVAAASRRRALKQNSPGDGITTAQWQQVQADSLGLCTYCNKKTTLTLEHIDPLSKGGAHDISNAAAACKPCNSSKHNTPLLVWLAQLALARELKQLKLTTARNAVVVGG